MPAPVSLAIILGVFSRRIVGCGRWGTTCAPRGLQVPDEFLTNLSPMGMEHIGVRYYMENSSVC